MSKDFKTPREKVLRAGPWVEGLDSFIKPLNMRLAFSKICTLCMEVPSVASEFREGHVTRCQAHPFTHSSHIF